MENMYLEGEVVLKLKVLLGENIIVGNTNSGYLKVIPIIGGRFFGKDIEGEIIPGGADWNTKFNENISHVFAKYVLKTSDNIYITIENEGIINKEITNKVIKTVPKFQVDKNSKYKWLLDSVFVGSIETDQTNKSAINITIYKMK